jgi:membrane-associated protease RseP (regulator of RpoE activity)
VDPNLSQSDDDQSQNTPASDARLANHGAGAEFPTGLTNNSLEPAATVANPDSVASRPTMRAEEYRRLLEKKIRRMYPWSVLLFVAACGSTWYVGGPVYAAGVMGILLAHELGHYIQALRYRVPASPPMFIPMPFLMLGTMGAVIVQGAGFANRKALFDIAISGPLAGLVFAIPIAWWGLQDSTVVTIDPSQGALILGDPLILKWMYEARHGVLAQNQEVALNPLLFAGWVGIFITALNLMPIGQLDGGHILYTLIGRKAHWVAYGIVGCTIAWMVIQQDPSFALMIGLLYAFGLKHPPSADDTAPVGVFRILLGWLVLAFVFIGFTPFPITAQQPTPPAVSSQEIPAS